MLIEVNGGLIPSERVKFVHLPRRGEESFVLETLEGDQKSFHWEDVVNALSTTIPANPGYYVLSYPKTREECDTFFVDKLDVVAWRETQDGIFPILLPADRMWAEDLSTILSPSGMVSQCDHGPLKFEESLAMKEKEWAATRPVEVAA
jgi:hypothetical protein